MKNYATEASQQITLDGIALQVFVSILSNSGGPIQANGMHGWGLTNCTLEDVAGFSYDAAREFVGVYQRMRKPEGA